MHGAKLVHCALRLFVNCYLVHITSYQSLFLLARNVDICACPTPNETLCAVTHCAISQSPLIVPSFYSFFPLFLTPVRSSKLETRFPGRPLRLLIKHLLLIFLRTNNNFFQSRFAGVTESLPFSVFVAAVVNHKGTKVNHKSYLKRLEQGGPFSPATIKLTATPVVFSGLCMLSLFCFRRSSSNYAYARFFFLSFTTIFE